MNNDSPEIYTCEFAPEIIDFLYGEISGERKNAFNRHLRNCSDCSDEVADFSDLKFSIRDWKSDFDRIETPKIIIPYDQKPVTAVVETEKSSWLDGVRNYFNLSPIFSGAMALVIFALILGFGFLYFGGNKDTLIADNNDNTVIKNKPAESPKKVIEPVSETAENVNKNQKEKGISIDDTVQKSVEDVQIAVPEKAVNNLTKKQKERPLKAINIKNPTADTPVNVKQDSKTVKSKNKPRLNELPDEDEDESLRLTDLFAELDTRE